MGSMVVRDLPEGISRGLSVDRGMIGDRAIPTEAAKSQRCP